MEKDTDNWFERHRIITVSVVILVIWFSIFYLLWSKADEVTKDPCTICAENMGKDVFCTTQLGIPVTKTYMVNGSTYTNIDEVRGIIKEELGNRTKESFGAVDINFSNVVK